MSARDVTCDVIIDDVCVASERYANARGLATADGRVILMTKVRRCCVSLSGISLSSNYYQEVRINKGVQLLGPELAEQ